MHLASERNAFGVFRSYVDIKPTMDPEEELEIKNLCDAPAFLDAIESRRRLNPLQGFGRRLKEGISAMNIFAPFQNVSIFRLMYWQNTGSTTKSAGELDRLVNEVLTAPDFDPNDLKEFRAARELSRLDDDKEEEDEFFPAKDGWRKASIKIPLPKEGVKYSSEDKAPQFEVKGLVYRPLLETIKAAYSDPAAQMYHFIPHKLFWRRQSARQSTSTNPDLTPTPVDDTSTATPPPHSEPSEPSHPSDGPEVEHIRIFSEVYNSDAMLKEDAAIRAQPRSPEDPADLEYAVVPMLFYSDATRLANFGTQSLWPIYLFFGSLSKYVRSKPSAMAAQHLAYMPTLPDGLQDFYKTFYGKSATAATLKFCKRELLQRIWLLLLDKDFMEAYEHGVLLACLRFLAKCPCPRCYIKKNFMSAMGTVADAYRRAKLRIDNTHIQDKISRTRGWMFEQGRGAASAAIERVLETRSLFPNRSAFSERFARFNFNFYAMFVPDLMHEFELGVWKAILIHLLRILHAQGGDTVTEFNHRFRNVPTFGDAIRRFAEDISALKKITARDYEDILQCIIPVFDGLLPEPHNSIVMDMLFELANWHALAKLRLHTEETLTLLENSTQTLSAAVRKFQQTTCRHYDTRELPKEQAARGRRTARTSAKKGAVSATSGKGKSRAEGPKRKELNLCTYKWHSLPDYAATIRQFGPSDGFTTQQGECEHRRVKKFYPRISKKQTAYEIAMQAARERKVQRIHKHVLAVKKRNAEARRREQAAQRAENSSHPIPRRNPALECDLQEELPPSSPTKHHEMSDSDRHWLYLPRWVEHNSDDPAMQEFLPQLKNHLLARVLGRAFDGDEHAFSDKDRTYLRFRQDRIYFHQTLRINYTTYDMRRDQDVINPRTHSDIMVHAHEDDSDTDISSQHPYWYARVIAIFHAYVRFDGSRTPDMQQQDEYQRMEFVWIRWFGRDLETPGGFETRRLHLVGFIGENDTAAFGFLDPKEIIRGVHLIPAGAYGRTRELLAPSPLARRDEDEDEDWVRFYVGMDMFMRFLGGGVGHSNSTPNWVHTKVNTSLTVNDDRIFEPNGDGSERLGPQASNSSLLQEDPDNIAVEDSDDDSDSDSNDDQPLDEEEDDSDAGIEDENDDQPPNEDDRASVEDEVVDYGYASSSSSDPDGSDEEGPEGELEGNGHDVGDDLDDELEGFGHL
ncbi:hypothetical protein EUX98_g7896 [Antrodiella citrinella]|uniref:Uncharacterized protein n=1 Tax=Antrodiella citrinella TaxID=2447956 RepID=A0A4S4MEF3_9APHY|nr:hypothetical protein EUX98_g7896 [Antrodiella citrinella]